MEKDNSKKPLTPKRERFCTFYVGECNGNATASYQTAYGCGYDVAKTNASRLLTDANVQARLQALMAKNGLTDVVVDFELRRSYFRTTTSP